MKRLVFGEDNIQDIIKEDGENKNSMKRMMT